MVVAVLASQFAPSSRGLRRGSSRGAKNRMDVSLQGDEYHNIANDIIQHPNTTKQSQHTPTGHRRKKFRAMSCLTSLASDLDVISDWFFYFTTLANDRQYRHENDGDYLIPPLLLSLVLTTCVTGTILWLVLATDGRIVAPLFRLLGIDKLSMGMTLFLCVIFEDIPQVILTFLVEDYYEEDHNLSNFALWNVMASLYDTLIKLAEAFDERNDIVETGAWCKDSIQVHSQKVTSVVVLPPELRGVSMSTLRRTSLLDVAALKPTQLPAIRFLTASLDGTVRLWKISDTLNDVENRQSCIHIFRGHKRGVTCLALLGEKRETKRTLKDSSSGRNLTADQSIQFLSGSHDGYVKLWDLCGDCLRAFPSHGDDVLSISIVKDWSTFVAGYQSGSVKLWDLSSECVMAAYRGHGFGGCSVVCSMKDETSFVASANDQTILLWDTKSARENYEIEKTTKDQSARSFDLKPSGNERRFPRDICSVPYHEETKSSAVFRGHTGRIMCIACVEPGVLFCSGSDDCTARLWSIQEGGSCLRLFLGHSGFVSSITAIDPVTLVTGSSDTNVKVWDTTSGSCLRTYTGHTKEVTAVSIAQDETTFVTASENTVKLWLLTTVSPEDTSDSSLDTVLDCNEGICRGLDPL